MPEISTLALFAGAALILLVTPGPSVLYIVGRSMDQGRAAGILSVLGVATGALVWVGATAVGLAAVLYSSVMAFTLVKYLGALYLVYLGVRKFLAEESGDDRADRPAASLWKLYAQGFLVELLNPKVALFFLAFLPQFVDPRKGHVSVQLLFLGGLFVVLGILTDSAWALLAGATGGLLRRRPGYLRIQRYVTGSVFIALGLGAAWAGSGNRK